MRIDLFKGPAVSEYCKKTKQVEARKFVVEYDLGKLLQDEISNAHFKEVKEKTLAELGLYSKVNDGSRNYNELIMGCTSDCFRTLELLGVGRFSRQWVVHVDFSERLDYFLHLLSGCPTSSIRAIPNYSGISRALLNLNLQDLQKFEFGSLFGINQELDSYLLCTLGRTAIGSDTASLSDMSEQLAFNVCRDVMQKVAAVRDFVVTDYVLKSNGSLVFRSHGFCDAICTSEQQMSDILEIHSETNGVQNEICYVQVRSYARLDYAYSEVR